jgi:hypothetical protein
MAKGMALTIGLNAVDPKHYGGWSGDLNACEADAADVADIAKAKGFKTQTLVTRSATRKNVIKAMDKAAVSLQTGDIFLLFYSGHGGQVQTANLLAAWNNGHFKRSYKSFHKAIIKRMPPDQTPNYYWVGAYDRKFERQTPFTV